MKEIFKGYYNLNESQFRILWDNAIFIFDTNVLLNLYRYQSSTRDSLLKVMETLGSRVWIPYHVGLEFQRNRLTVIAEQHNRFSEVKNIVEDSISKMENGFNELQLRKRHTYINPDKLLEDINKLKSAFFEQLNKLEKQSININSNDEIRERLDLLFADKIGSPPSDQKIMDELFKEGEIRYINNIPPGFKDSTKGEKNTDGFTYNGIKYKRKFGDLIIWKQIIEFSSKSKNKNIIFITDDNKADWWCKININGPKTIGVRPELKDELYREGKVENFHIYNTEQFLRYANSHLNAQVETAAIEEIREVSHEFRNKFQNNTLLLGISAEREVYSWLLSKFLRVEQTSTFPDFIAYQDDKKIGFEVKILRDYKNIGRIFRDLDYRLNHIVNKEFFHELNIIIVLLDDESIYKAEEIISRKYIKTEINMQIILGKPDYIDEGGGLKGFHPIITIDLRNN